MNNLGWLTVLVVIESLQVLIAAIYINTFFPSSSGLQGQILPEWATDFKPEREALLYHIFILTAVVLEAAAVYRFRSKLTDAFWGRKLKRFLAVESVVLMLLVYVICKIVMYDHPYVKDFIWPALLVVAAGIKTFWTPLKKYANTLWAYFHNDAHTVSLTRVVDVCVPIFIFLVIYLPNIEGTVARTWIGEQWHHFDTLIMAPAFAASQGCLLNVDVNSQYGVGMPMVMAFVAKIMGGVTYKNILALLMTGCIVYFWLCYVFLRIWIKSALLSAIAIVIGLKWQMFHIGMYPDVFSIPNGLSVRYFWDIVFFMLVYRYIQTQESWALLLASVVTGGAIVWVSDTGGFLVIAFYAYLLYLLAENHFIRGIKAGRNLWLLARYFVIAPGVAIGLYWLAIGNNVFHPVFWNNVKEFFQFFQDGYEALPIYQTLTEHHYLQNLIGFVVPGVYMLTFLSVVSLIFLKKIRPENAMVVVLSAYGFGTYHYYLNRSASTSYFVECMPYVFILCFWLKQALSFVPQRQGRNIALGLLAFCLFSLLTTHQFLEYPNFLSLSRNPYTDPMVRPEEQGQTHFFNHLFTRVPEELKLPVNSLGQTDEKWVTEDDFKSDRQLVDYYHKEMDFSQDVALIDGLTAPGSSAAVMSSYDIQMLIEANRKPFFYCFPLLVSRPMRMRNFPSSHLHTIARLERTLRQIQDQKPEYIFMEKIFLINQVSANFYFWTMDTVALVNYVRQNYVPYKQGYYLVAMKRK